MTQLHGEDEELLRQRLEGTSPRELISDETAIALAKWFARAIGPGFHLFLTSGLITPDFYRELVCLYEQRRPEVEVWLDRLAHYTIRQPASGLGDEREPGGNQ